MPDNKELFLPKLKMILAVIFWGGSFIAIKIAVQQTTPATVVWLRFLIGILCLLPFIIKKGLLHISSWKEAGEYVVLGFLGVTLHQWLQSSGLVTSQASTTAWIVASTPLFMVLMGWLFLKEKLGNYGAIGIGLATLGVLMVVSAGDIRGIFKNGFGAPGDIYVLLSAPNWALYSILLRSTLKRQSALQATFFSMLFGWLLTNIQFIAEKSWQQFPQFDLSGWGSILYLGVFCTFLAYLFYYDALQNLSSTTVGAYLYIEPLAAMLFAAFILQEAITLASLLGGGLIIGGVMLVNRQNGKATKPEDPVIPIE